MIEGWLRPDRNSGWPHTNHRFSQVIHYIVRVARRNDESSYGRVIRVQRNGDLFECFCRGSNNDATHIQSIYKTSNHIRNDGVFFRHSSQHRDSDRTKWAFPEMNHMPLRVNTTQRIRLLFRVDLGFTRQHEVSFEMGFPAEFPCVINALCPSVNESIKCFIQIN
jgi:hypothetical protein